MSTEVLAEVERNLIADFPQLDPDSLRRRVNQMRDALDDHVVDPGSLDAALAGGASVVVTNDGRLRSETETAIVDLLPMSADAFAAHLWQLTPEGVDEVINTLVAKRTKRPVTVDELMEAMRGPFSTMTSAWLASRV